MVDNSRRGFLLGALGIIAAPAIVRASSLMRVKQYIEYQGYDGFSPFDGHPMCRCHLSCDMSAFTEALAKGREAIIRAFSLEPDLIGGGVKLVPMVEYQSAALLEYAQRAN